MANETIPRRGFLAGAGAGAASVAALTTGLPATAAEPSASPAAQATASPPETWLVLTAEEAAFFAAVADTMIPADALSPSGSECGVPVFIDRQLASAWGAGARMYRAGPFHPGPAGTGLSAAADTARLLRRGRCGHQCLVATRPMARRLTG